MVTKNRSCYIFGKETQEVSIEQCILGKDIYIIWKLESKIVEVVKKDLVQLGDVKQRHKVCLTLADIQGNLLKIHPKT